MLIAASDMLSGGVWWALIALCAVAVAVVELRRWQFRRVSLRDITRAEQAALREQRELQREQREIQQQTAVLISELENTAERVSKLIEERMAGLHAALREAEERAAATARVGGTEQIPSAATSDLGVRHMSSVAQQASPAWTGAGSPQACSPEASEAPRTRSAAPSPRDGREDQLIRASARPLDELLPPRDGRLDRILELAAAGRRPMQIAEALGMPLGEVELVLNLHRIEAGG